MKRCIKLSRGRKKDRKGAYRKRRDREEGGGRERVTLLIVSVELIYIYHNFILVFIFHQGSLFSKCWSSMHGTLKINHNYNYGQLKKTKYNQTQSSINTANTILHIIIQFYKIKIKIKI